MRPASPRYLKLDALLLWPKNICVPIHSPGPVALRTSPKARDKRAARFEPPANLCKQRSLLRRGHMRNRIERTYRVE